MDKNQIPIKVAEISINKFNEQIHQKVIQLRTFRLAKSNKTSSSDLEKLRKDAINCLRVVKQLKQLLLEIDNLKIQTRTNDHDKFDELISVRRNEALNEIRMYQDMKPIDKLNELSHNATNHTECSNSSTHAREHDMNIQLQIEDAEIKKRELESRALLLKEVENLHSECEAVSQLYKHVNVMVAEQAPMVDAIEENVQIAEIQVEEGTKELAKALSYKQTMYPIVGGFLGACAFGPLGLVAGIKAGTAAGVCGGICGFAISNRIKKASNSPTTLEATVVDDSDIGVEQNKNILNKTDN